MATAVIGTMHQLTAEQATPPRAPTRDRTSRTARPSVTDAVGQRERRVPPRKGQPHVRVDQPEAGPLTDRSDPPVGGAPIETLTALQAEVFDLDGTRSDNEPRPGSVHRGLGSLAVSDANSEDAPVEVPGTRTRRPRMPSCLWRAPEVVDAVPVEEFRRS